MLGGDVFGIVKGTPNRAMALDFARYFMSKEVQEQLTAQLGWPAMRTDAFGPSQEWQQPYFETILAALEHSQARPNVTYWLEVERILSDAFNDVVTGGSRSRRRCTRYQQQIQQLGVDGETT